MKSQRHSNLVNIVATALITQCDNLQSVYKYIRYTAYNVMIKTVSDPSIRVPRSRSWTRKHPASPRTPS